MAFIDGDGPNPDIYHLIWKNEGPYLAKSQIHVPETIIFIHGIPTAWYFTNNEGKILRKKAKNLSHENIVQRFTAKQSQQDIVGYFIHIDSDKIQERLFTRQRSKNAIHEDLPSSRSLIEYYTAEEFAVEFANLNVCRHRTGILQRFIQPAGGHNGLEVIQAVWSPNLCVFTKRINSRKIEDPKLKPYEKASTFDGPDFYSRSVPLVGKHIPSKLREQCEALVDHITNISFEKIIIERLVAYFKVDANEKVYFLWASSVRVKKNEKYERRYSSCQDKPITLEPCVQNIEALKNKKSQRASSCAAKGNSCVACDILSDNLVPITFKILIGKQPFFEKTDNRSYSSVRLSNNNNEASQRERIDVEKLKQASMNGGLPPFIARLYPRLKLKNFMSLCQQENFLTQKTKVCEDCFLKATRDYEKTLLEGLNPPQKSARILKRSVSRERPPVNSHRRIRIKQYESSCDNTTLIQQPEPNLLEKPQSQSACKVPIDPLYATNSSRSTVASSIAANLKLRMSLLLLKRRESLALSEKSDLCSGSLHQNSSPARLKNPNISEHLHGLAERLSQNSANVSLAKDKFDFSSRDSSMLTKASLVCPRPKPRSLNQLNNVSSSRIHHSRNEIRDIDDLLNESDQETATFEQKQCDDQSDVTTAYQSSLRERYSRNGSRLLEAKDLPPQKSSDRQQRTTRVNPIQLVNESYASVGVDLVSQVKRMEISKNNEQDQSVFIRSFFIKPGFPQQPPSGRTTASSKYILQHQRSMMRTSRVEDSDTIRAYASTKRERTETLSATSKDKENLQKSVVIEKLYKTRVNTAHRAKTKRI